jgi:hypothetical protein
MAKPFPSDAEIQAFIQLHKRFLTPKDLEYFRKLAHRIRALQRKIKAIEPTKKSGFHDEHNARLLQRMYRWGLWLNWFEMRMRTRKREKAFVKQIAKKGSISMGKSRLPKRSRRK